MIRARLCIGVVAAILAYGCSGDPDGSERATSSSSSRAVAAERVIVRGHATLDGTPFDGEFIGAAVRNHGLVTPCQATLPGVDRGLYVVEVMSAGAAIGCGAPGSEILLWTFTGNTQYFSGDAVPWPADGSPTTFDASFTSTTPKGAAPPTTEFAGEVFERDGRRLPDEHASRRMWDRHAAASRRCEPQGDSPGSAPRSSDPSRLPVRKRRDRHVPRRRTGQAVTTAVNDFRSVPSLDLTLP